MLPVSPAFDNFVDISLDDVAATVPLQRLVWPALDHLNLQLYFHRDDLISATYSGNKFYKLYYNITQAMAEQRSVLMSFGGAYSNHIHALAALGHALNIKTVGLIRGHRPTVLSPTLQDAIAWGMQLHFMDKKSFRAQNLNALPQGLKALIESQAVHIIPEGGDNLAGVKGCIAIGRAIAKKVQAPHYTLCSATATGTTLAGLVAGSPKHCKNIGFSVLKGDDVITQSVQHTLASLAANNTSFSVKTGFHCGGYANVNDSLIAFMKGFEQANQLMLEPVYTAKMLLAIEQLALEGYWSAGECIVAVHSGGVQGRRGYKELL